MPEYLIVIAISGVLGTFGVTFRRINSLDSELDLFKVKVAEEYVQKAALDSAVEQIMKRLDRLEDKLDAASRVEHERVMLLKQIQMYKDQND